MPPPGLHKQLHHCEDAFYAAFSPNECSCLSQNGYIENDIKDTQDKMASSQLGFALRGPYLLVNLLVLFAAAIIYRSAAH